MKMIVRVVTPLAAARYPPGCSEEERVRTVVSMRPHVLTRSSSLLLLEQLSCASWSLTWPGFQVRSFGNETKRLRNSSFQLGINVVGIVLWCDIDLNVWVRTIVLYIPTHILEPEGILGLRGIGTIH